MLKFVGHTRANSHLTPFVKYEATGCDYVIAVDDGDGRWRRFCESQAEVARLLNRRLGVGGLGLLLLERQAEYGVKVTRLGVSGLRQGFCPQAGLAAVAYAVTHDLLPKTVDDHDDDDVRLVRFLAADGPHIAIFHEDNGRHKVSLKLHNVKHAGRLDDHNYDVTCGGSRYHIRYVVELQEYDVRRHGQLISGSKRYEQVGGQVDCVFAQVDADGHVFIRVYERVADCEVAGSGGGAVAAALAEVLKQPWKCYTPWNPPDDEQWSSLPRQPQNIDERVVHMPGGTMKVTCERVGVTSFRNIYLTGPTREVFSGTYELSEDTTC